MSDETKPKIYPANSVHVLRTAQQTHVHLSDMADQKANMLLAAAFVIFTLAIGQAQGSAAQLPLLIVGGSAFLAAVFAVLAVMPATRYRTGGGSNLFFFGTFERFGEEEFLDRIMAEVANEESSLRMMGRDLYQNGIVLARKKYRLLGYAYRIFLAGLFASLAAFLVQLSGQSG